MKTHSELVEEVYQNSSFRSEFICYVKLSNAIKAELQAMAEAASRLPVPWYKKNYSGMTYYELLDNPLPPQLVGRMRNANILYCSLGKGLSVRYGLKHDQVKLLIRDVANRYA